MSGIISDMSTNLLPLTILSASVALGTETEDWTLDAPAGEEDPIRSFAFEIAFATPFSAPPVVHLGLSGFDLDQCSSARITVTAELVSEFGFVARISTWRSSRVYSVEFNWLAIGS